MSTTSLALAGRFPPDPGVIATVALVALCVGVMVAPRIILPRLIPGTSFMAQIVRALLTAVIFFAGLAALVFVALHGLL